MIKSIQVIDEVDGLVTYQAEYDGSPNPATYFLSKVDFKVKKAIADLEISGKITYEEARNLESVIANKVADSYDAGCADGENSGDSF